MVEMKWNFSLISLMKLRDVALLQSKTNVVFKKGCLLNSKMVTLASKQNVFNS